MKCSEVVESDNFRKQIKKIKKKYRKSESRIQKEIDSLKNNPHKGDRAPGYGDLELRKFRIPLLEYGRGQSDGLRVIYLFLNSKVYPIAIYAKSDFKSESDVIAFVKKSLKRLIKEILG